MSMIGPVDSTIAWSNPGNLVAGRSWVDGVAAVVDVACFVAHLDDPGSMSDERCGGTLEVEVADEIDARVPGVGRQTERARGSPGSLCSVTSGPVHHYMLSLVRSSCSSRKIACCFHYSLEASQVAFSISAPTSSFSASAPSHDLTNLP